MKSVFAKTLVVLASVVLVAPFVAVALLVGARAVAGAESAEQRLVLAALALGGALYGAAKGWAREEAGGREGHALHVTPTRARPTEGRTLIHSQCL
jgi:hypothetical protein